jgi:hypothetical protein
MSIKVMVKSNVNTAYNGRAIVPGDTLKVDKITAERWEKDDIARIIKAQKPKKGARKTKKKIGE